MAEKLITTASAAALIKVSPRRLQQLARDGWIVAHRRGAWPLTGVIEGYLDYLRSRQPKPSVSALQDVKARQIEQRLARQDRREIAMAEALRTADTLSANLVASIRDLPRQITRDPRERHRITLICEAEAARLSGQFARARAEFKAGSRLNPEDEKD